MITIITEHPEAVGSPDFSAPIGAIQDNHSNPVYLAELERVAGAKRFSYLDLACAGGQSVVDVYEAGNIACGVEGSSLEKILASTRWQPTYLGGDVVKSGAENWKNYKDTCLFKSDISKPFELRNKDGEIQTFDIITAWDFLEHPLPEEIPTVINNIKKHLAENGTFICLVSLAHGSHHRCVRPRMWWLDQFSQKGLIDIGFSFNASPRHTVPPITPDDLGFAFKHK